MTRFVKVAEVSDFAVKRSKRVTIENTDIALFAVGEQFLAVGNDCPHQHFSALHEGILHEHEITCPMHGWTFDLATGKATVGGGRLKTYAVKVIGNEIHIEAPTGEPDWAMQ
ncbi:MAG TPA: ferredoxin [Bacteroidetes bacterium]|nr:ferredoxin [Bacteroidota bacterium]